MPFSIPTGGTVAEVETSVTLPQRAASETAATGTRQGGRSLSGFAMRSASAPGRLLPVSVSVDRGGTGDVSPGETASFETTVTNPGGLSRTVTVTLAVETASGGG